MASTTRLRDRSKLGSATCKQEGECTAEQQIRRPFPDYTGAVQHVRAGVRHLHDSHIQPGKSTGRIQRLQANVLKTLRGLVPPAVSWQGIMQCRIKLASNRRQ